MRSTLQSLVQFLSLSVLCQLLKAILFSLGSWFVSNRRFIIVSNPRSGSTLLVNLLNNHPNITCKGEILGDEDVYGIISRMTATRLSIHVRAMFSWASSSHIIGAKVQLHQFKEVPMTIERMYQLLKKPKLLILYRKNLLESYVSLKIAEATGSWYSCKPQKTHKVKVDWEDFEQYCRRRKKEWEMFFKFAHNARVDPKDMLIVEFDDLLDSQKDVTMKRIFEWFELKQVSTKATSVRQNPAPLSEKIENWNEKIFETDNDHGLLDMKKISKIK